MAKKKKYVVSKAAQKRMLKSDIGDARIKLRTLQERGKYIEVMINEHRGATISSRNLALVTAAQNLQNALTAQIFDLGLLMEVKAKKLRRLK